MAVAENVVKSRRAELGLSMEGLAREAGVSISTIYRTERGLCRPQLAKRQRIAAVLGVEPDDLIWDGREKAAAAP